MKTARHLRPRGSALGEHHLAAQLRAWLRARRRIVRALSFGLVGLAALVVGLATSIPHAILSGPSGIDYIGIPAAAGGIVLIGLAFHVALRGRRMVVKLALGALAICVIAQWLLAPALNVGLITNAPRPAVPMAATLGLAGARDVNFPASDGVRLAGWYVPGHKGTTVIVLHGSHGSRSDTVPYLHMLVSYGFNVLAFDARGHGHSAGHTNALGWAGARDIAGAVTFLTRQPGLDRHRIAALGLSMGAEEALRAAATGVPLHAIVADGAGASTLSDEQLQPHALAPIFTSDAWLTMRGTELVSHDSEPAGLNEIVSRIQVPVLLIASSASGELTIDRAYRDRIGPRASLWYLPNAGHTGGLGTYPSLYAARVTSFFDAALARS